jgi:hypothetical protein
MRTFPSQPETFSSRNDDTSLVTPRNGGPNKLKLTASDNRLLTLGNRNKGLCYEVLKHTLCSKSKNSAQQCTFRFHWLGSRKEFSVAITVLKHLHHKVATWCFASSSFPHVPVHLPTRAACQRGDNNLVVQSCGTIYTWRLFFWLEHY